LSRYPKVLTQDLAGFTHIREALTSFSQTCFIIPPRFSLVARGLFCHPQQGFFHLKGFDRHLCFFAEYPVRGSRLTTQLCQAGLVYRTNPFSSDLTEPYAVYLPTHLFSPSSATPAGVSRSSDTGKPFDLARRNHRNACSSSFTVPWPTADRKARKYCASASSDWAAF